MGKQTTAAMVKKELELQKYVTKPQRAMLAKGQMNIFVMVFSELYHHAYFVEPKPCKTIHYCKML